MRARTVLTGLVILALTGAGVSLAGEMSGSGEAIVVSSPPKETPLPGGDTFLELQTQEIMLASDAGHPFHHVAMTCVGTCTVDAEGGMTTCAGGCTGQDPDGDVITFSWDGFDGGGWKLVGGTGKWSGASGWGSWKSAGPMGAGFTRNTWSDSIEME